MILTILSCIRSHMTSYIHERGLRTHRSHAREHSRSGLESAPWPLFRPFQRFRSPPGRVELGCCGRHHGHAHGSRMATQRPCNTCIGWVGWSSASRALGRLPADPPSPPWPSCTPTTPLMHGVAVEARKYEVGREEDATGVVQEHRGACQRGRLRPAGTKGRRRVSVGERGNARGARAVETHPAAVLGGVVDELQPPGW